MSKELNKAPAEQAGGDERAAFEQWLEQHMSHHFSPELDLAKYEDSGEYRYNPAADYWKAWQARAALAQPSLDHAVQAHDIPMLIASEHANPDYAMGWNDCRAKIIGASSAVQAEKAEVELPKLERPKHWGLHGANFRAGFKAAEAQHDRIVGELRADRDSWAEQAEQRLADWDEMRKERDAALVRVEQQERTIAGMNEAHAKLAGLYEAAQAQHSVPAYVSYTTRPAESLAGIALRQLKDESRWVEIRDINAHAFPDMQSHSYYPAGTVIKLPAAAPGKEGV
ncbi:TPA: LysM peptidoglycan-binding domain-containing protein [Pseudomonas aeruginosa]